MVLPLIASVAGGLIAARGASKAADAQKDASREQIAYSRETRDLIRDDIAPWLQSGRKAQNALWGEIGGGFQESPGYQFAFNEGQRAIDGSAAARGQLFSGATLKAQNRFGQGIANQEYGTYLNRLTDMSNSGQNAAGMNATAATNSAAQVNSALGSYGDAAAAGAVGVGNAINKGISNAIGVYNYQNKINGG